MASNPIELAFVIVDVFTNKKYEGNPLAIVEIPNSVSVSQEQKQAIAREFNLSETSFLHLDESNVDASSWKVDIFMTTHELPFAGHPTIGTACHILSKVARNRGVVKGNIEAGFKVKAGPIQLQYDVEKNKARATIPHNVHIHKRTYGREELLKLQPRLAEASRGNKISLRDDFPIVSVVKGMTFVLVELESEEALGLIGTTTWTLSVDGLDAEWNKTFVGMYFFVSQKKSAGIKALRTRMIEGTLEDPATGSAASDLAGYLSLVEGKPKESLRYEIVQGVEMGRRSEIVVEVVMADSEEAGISAIYLEGSSIPVMKGHLTV